MIIKENELPSVKSTLIKMMNEQDVPVKHILGMIIATNAGLILDIENLRMKYEQLRCFLTQVDNIPKDFRLATGEEPFK